VYPIKSELARRLKRRRQLPDSAPVGRALGATPARQAAALPHNVALSAGQKAGGFKLGQIE